MNDNNLTSNFPDFIRPICLPTKDYRPLFTTATNFIVAGWGSDAEHQMSDVKKSVNLPYVPMEDCEEPLAGDSRICAGGEKGKDSCTGMISIYTSFNNVM